MHRKESLDFGCPTAPIVQTLCRGHSGEVLVSVGWGLEHCPPFGFEVIPETHDQGVVFSA